MTSQRIKQLVERAVTSAVDTIEIGFEPRGTIAIIDILCLIRDEAVHRMRGEYGNVDEEDD